MKIGTDISLACCKYEGYMIMEYAGRGEDKLMVRGELQKDVRCEFYTHWPSYCMEEKGYLVFEDGRCMKPSGEGSYQLKVKTSGGVFRNGLHKSLQTMRFCRWPKSMSQSYTAQDVWEMYLEQKAQVHSICGYEEAIEFPTSPSDLLQLATDVNSTGYFHTDCGEKL